MSTFCRSVQSGMKGICIEVDWLEVCATTGGSGVWYSTEKEDGDAILQWKSAISGASPTNMFSYVPSSRGLSRIYRRSYSRP